MILKMHPFGQSQSKISAVSGNVDQSKPDSHFDSQIDPYISCILIVFVAECNTNAKGNTVPRPWETSLHSSPLPVVGGLCNILKFLVQRFPPNRGNLCVIQPEIMLKS